MKKTDQAASVPSRLVVEQIDPEMVKVLSAKTGAERLALASKMYQAAGEMIESHLRSRRPDWGTAQIRTEVARRLSRGSG